MPEGLAQELKLSRYIVESDLLTLKETGLSYYLIFSTISGSTVSIHATTWNLIRTGRFDQLSANTREELINAQILVPKELDEFKQVIGENISETEENDILYQVVQPTAWCQLSCSYCGQEHSQQKLSQSEQDKFIERIRTRLATGRYRHLKIGWFGGEPLAGLSVIHSLSLQAVKIAEYYNCNFSARIITNGILLTPGIAADLYVRCHIHEAEITLDGTSSDHDSRRHTKAGKKTFQHIFTNICRVANETQMRLVIRCNVDRSNASGVSKLIDSFADAGLADRITFYTSPVYSWGNNAHENALRKEEYALHEIDWMAQQLRLGFKVGLVPMRRKVVCMAVQSDAEVVDAYGNSFNCTEVPYVPAYGEPNVYANINSSHDSSDTSIGYSPASLRLKNFNLQLLNCEHVTCADCVMLPVCGGQCPKSWHEGHPPCPSAKLNMSQRLNLLFALSRLAQ